LLPLALAFSLLASCGLSGDSDDDASGGDDTNEAATEPLSTPIRISFGDKWVEVTRSELGLTTAGAPTALAADELADHVRDLTATGRLPVDARVEYTGTSFEAVDGVGGQEPDLTELARRLVAASEDGTGTVEVPFSPVEPELSLSRAQDVADMLNTRAGDGITVSVGAETATLPLSLIGPATEITLGLTDWDLDIRWDEIADGIAARFPNVGAPGGEAIFAIEEDDDGENVVVIIPGAPATVCCDAASVDRLKQALRVDLEVARLTLARVDGERGQQWAEEQGVVELIGSFTTSYTPGQNRVTNIRRIAELTQGVLIEPGETFSLNAHVGRRTTENGFVPAGTIVNGHLVDSVGGGISQFATTLFNASFFGGLEFGQYQSHSIYFSRYPYGREATISWPAPALEIVNPTPHAVLVWPTSTANSVTVDLYSTKLVEVEQTGQWENSIQAACTRVTTERTRTSIEDGTEVVDTVFATYRPEGIACDGTATEDPDAEQIEKLEDGEDPGFDDNPGDAGDDPADDPPAEDPPAEDPAAEDPPAEDPPAEDPPAEDPPAEDPPAEDPPAEDPPAEDPPAEDPPAEGE
jgi:hypothetical protein